ncbi:MAG: helix-turn-helix transcriptional regulator [Acutalibacteraceae bacterium]
MKTSKGFKSDRVLYMYDCLISGDTVKKSELSEHFGVSEKSIQRDIDALRCYLSDKGTGQDIIYDPSFRGYRLFEHDERKLTNSEVLAVCKILLESRSMIKPEMQAIIEKLLENCVPEHNKRKVNDLIRNELYHYIEPHHGKSVLESLWDLGTAIREHRLIEVDYTRTKDGETKTRVLEPAGLLFSEYYFYLTAFVKDEEVRNDFENKDDLFPTIYRVDRIQRLQILEERFTVPYAERFEEGDFRKRVQFMYGGNLRKIKFRYKGKSVEAVLDRLPTARIISHDDTGYFISAEVFGNGIDMWIRSQGENVEMIKDE